MLDIGLDKRFSCNFIHANITKPVLGANFLRQSRLLWRNIEETESWKVTQAFYHLEGFYDSHIQRLVGGERNKLSILLMVSCGKVFVT